MLKRFVHALSPATAVLLCSAANAAIPVVREDFSDDPGGAWRDTTGNFPTNAGLPGQWLPSGHVGNLNPFRPLNTDSDWKAHVQNQVGAAGPVSTGNYQATLNRTSAQSGSEGVFNMDGILKFTLANGTARSAVTGEKVVGSFDFYVQTGILGFGFTDNISSLQTYQAALPQWKGTAPAPLMMPTAYNDSEQDGEGGFIHVGMSSNVTGQISINPGNNNLFTHAVVDIAENGGAGDAFVDLGSDTPKTDPSSTAHRPLIPSSDARQTIRFEYTVGNNVYDLLQVDQDGPALPGGFVDILQSLSTPTPNPGGPMPVGKVVSSIEGFFITGANSVTTEAWYDNINIDIVAPTATGWIGNSGPWETASNWAGNSVPNAVDAVALFAQAGSGSQLISISSAITTGTLRFDSPISYKLTGTGSLNIQAGSSGTVEALSGSHEIGVPLNFASNSVLTVGNPAALTISAPATVLAGKVVNKNGNLTIAAQLKLEAGASLVSNSGSLSVLGAPVIEAGSKLDLKDNSMTVSYQSLANASSSVRSLIASAFANGAWTGSGITSSSIAPGSGTAVGWKDVPGSEQVQVRYTYAGDANLDGTVNSTDFNAFVAAYGATSGGVWSAGDFNYDEKINTLDFNTMSGNFGHTLAAPTLGSAVPEPASLSLVTIAISLSLAGRRCRRTSALTGITRQPVA